MRPLILVAALLAPCAVRAKSVFAHFMVGNTAEYTTDDWNTDIAAAQASLIDAFALNIAYDWSGNPSSLSAAFSAAEAVGFKLFFSFDYAGNGPWPKSDVLALIQQYGSHSAYFQYKGGPFVSTFEGPNNSGDWVDIKAQTNCFFIPDWSSVGAGPAWEKGVADGLFSWAAWPWGDRPMDTYVDASYNYTLAGAPLMMPASPWFYTNLPGFNKNWLWSGDSLWYDRWQQIWTVQPEFVEIISWNDYGESHYIGPLNEKAYVAFGDDVGEGHAPFNYAENMPHDGWRQFLPFLINMYKYGTAEFLEEGLQVWYRTSPKSSCDTGNTTGNTASQLQIEFPPTQIVEDAIFYSALLYESAELFITVGNELPYLASFQQTPDGGVGIYHGSYSLEGKSVNFEDGPVVFSLQRNSGSIAHIQGAIRGASQCNGTLTNWNAWVGSALASDLTPKSPPRNLDELGCVAGFGGNDFNELCQITCSYNYCPLGACVCTAMGEPRVRPASTGIVGYSKNGDPNYNGLCNFACNLGFCFEEYCSQTQQPVEIPTSSPFLPPACTAGTGSGDWQDLCKYGCSFGFCPYETCTCTENGTLVLPPAITSGQGYPLENAGFGSNMDNGLCNFACLRGTCPENICTYNATVTNDKLEAAKSTYNGIWWNEAAKTCTAEQFDILVEATRMGLELAEYNSLGMLRPGWGKFFLSDQNWERNAIGLYWKIQSMLRSLSRWPTAGFSPKQKRQYKVTYTCGDPDPYKNCRKQNVPAYSIFPDSSGSTRLDNCPRCKTIAFCDRFWTLKYLNDAKKTPHVESELGSLYTYEHVVVHEWLHQTDTFTTPRELSHVTDIQDQLTDNGANISIYGEPNTRKYAYKFASNSNGYWTGLNNMVAFNADNYAWMFTYEWFSTAYSWGKSADTPPDWPNLQITDDPSVSVGIVYNEPGDDTTPSDYSDDGVIPPNCDPSTSQCDYMGGDFYSDSYCILSIECYAGTDSGFMDPDCTCTCNGTQIANRDERCSSPLFYITT